MSTTVVNNYYRFIAYGWDGGVLDTGILLADLTPDETKEYNELIKRGYIKY